MTEELTTLVLEGITPKLLEELNLWMQEFKAAELKPGLPQAAVVEITGLTIEQFLRRVLRDTAMQRAMVRAQAEMQDKF